MPGEFDDWPTWIASDVADFVPNCPPGKVDLGARVAKPLRPERA